MQVFCKRLEIGQECIWEGKIGTGDRVRWYRHKRGKGWKRCTMDESANNKYWLKKFRWEDTPILIRDSEQKTEKSVGRCGLMAKSFFPICYWCEPYNLFLLQDTVGVGWGLSKSSHRKLQAGYFLPSNTVLYTLPWTYGHIIWKYNDLASTWHRGHLPGTLGINLLLGCQQKQVLGEFCHYRVLTSIQGLWWHLTRGVASRL